MTNPDLVTWCDATASILTTELPLQSLQNAVDLVFAYISDIGGWVPDDQQDPNGPGQPANGFTESQAAAAIAAEQIGDVYDIDLTVDVTVRCQFSAHLGTGLDLNAAAAAISADVTNFLTNAVNNSSLPMRVESTGTKTPDSSRSLLGGDTTADVRVIIFNDTAGTDKIIDYKATALLYTQITYGLDDTWNVQYVYTETDEPIVVYIAKYTDNTYVTLDSGSTTFYVLTMSPTTYQVVSGIILTL